LNEIKLEAEADAVQPGIHFSIRNSVVVQGDKEKYDSEGLSLNICVSFAGLKK
jgi:hypothetical protein